MANDASFDSELQNQIIQEANSLTGKASLNWMLMCLALSVASLALYSAFFEKVLRNNLIKFGAAADLLSLIPIVYYVACIFVIEGLASEFVNDQRQKPGNASKFRGRLHNLTPAAKVVFEGVLNSFSRSSASNIKAIKIEEDGAYKYKFKLHRAVIIFSMVAIASLFLSKRQRSAPSAASIAESTVHTLASKSVYLAGEDVEVLPIEIKSATKLRIIVSVENGVPIDVITLPERVNKSQFFVLLPLAMTGQVVGEMQGSEQVDLFSGPLSQKGVFRTFESPWVNVVPGTITIALDNTKFYTPSRGDAAVQLTIQTQP